MESLRHIACDPEHYFKEVEDQSLAMICELIDAGLTLMQAECFKASIVEGKTVREIGEEMGRPASRISECMSRAIKSCPQLKNIQRGPGRPHSRFIAGTLNLDSL